MRQLRQRGIDPFQRANGLEFVAPNAAQAKAAAGQMQIATAKVPAEQARVQLPQTVQHGQTMPPTYPRVFENMSLAFLIFAGVYLMISLTASILREQVSS